MTQQSATLQTCYIKAFCTSIKQYFVHPIDCDHLRERVLLCGHYHEFQTIRTETDRKLDRKVGLFIEPTRLMVLLARKCLALSVTNDKIES